MDVGVFGRQCPAPQVGFPTAFAKKLGAWFEATGALVRPGFLEPQKGTFLLLKNNLLCQFVLCDFRKAH